MNKSLITNITKLATARIIGQFIIFLAIPIISRLYLPEHFGVKQIYVSINSVFSAIACLRYELSIPLGKDEREANASFIISVLSTLAISLLLLGLIPFLRVKIGDIFDSHELATFLWLLPLSVLAGGLTHSLTYWSTWNERFGIVALFDIMLALGNSLLPIIFGLLSQPSAKGLLLSYIISSFLAMILLMVLLGRRLLSSIRSSALNRETIISVAKYHKQFPIFDTWTILATVLYSQLPAIILGWYYSKAVVGYYSMVEKTICSPLGMFVRSLVQVIFPHAAKEYNEKKNLSDTIEPMIKNIIQIMIFPIFSLMFLGPSLFGFFFGKKWISAGIYARILSVNFFFQLISSSLMIVFFILQRQKAKLLFSISLLSSRAATLISVSKFSTPVFSIIAFSFVSSLGDIIMSGWLLKAISINLSSVLKTFFKYLVISCLILFPAGFLSWYNYGIYLSLSIFLFSAVIYLIILYYSNSVVKNFIGNFILKCKQIVK